MFRSNRFWMVPIVLLIVTLISLLVYETTKYQKLAKAKASVTALTSVRTAFFASFDDEAELPPSITQINTNPQSWRVLVDNRLRDRNKVALLNLQEPWNSPSNSKLAEHSLTGFELLAVPHDKSEIHPTNYFVVVGESTAFPGTGSIFWTDITDGPENTVLVIEVSGSKHPWSKPGDIQFSELKSIYEGSSDYSLYVHKLGNGLVFADGEIYYMIKKPTFEAFESMFTISGGESWTRDELVATGVLISSPPIQALGLGAGTSQSVRSH